MTRQLCRAIVPILPLSRTIQAWGDISTALSDASRRRRMQVAGIHNALESRIVS
jgi:hypothetical protein